MKEKKLTQTFFNQRAVEYNKFAPDEWSKEIREKIRNITDQEIRGKVIDIGGGGEIHYEISKSALFVSCDISCQQFKKGVNNKLIYPVCGDAEDIPFKDGSFDRAICGFLLHHLVRSNSKKSGKFLSKILSGIYEILDNQGGIIIAENCLPEILEKIENFFFILFKTILELFGKPMVRFLSCSTISSLLREVGFTDITIIPIKEKKTWKFVSPAVILPFLKIPHKLVPTNLHIIMGRKP